MRRIGAAAGLLSSGLPGVASSWAMAWVRSGLLAPGAVAGGRRRSAARLPSRLQLSAGVGPPGLAPAVHGRRQVGARVWAFPSCGSRFAGYKKITRAPVSGSAVLLSELLSSRYSTSCGPSTRICRRGPPIRTDPRTPREIRSV